MMQRYQPKVSPVKAAQVPAGPEASGDFIGAVFSEGAKSATVVTEGIRVKFDGSRARVFPWGTWLVIDGGGAVSGLQDDEFRSTYGFDTVPADDPGPIGAVANGAAPEKAKVKA